MSDAAPSRRFCIFHKGFLLFGFVNCAFRDFSKWMVVDRTCCCCNKSLTVRVGCSTKSAVVQIPKGFSGICVCSLFISRFQYVCMWAVVDCTCCCCTKSLTVCVGCCTKSAVVQILKGFSGICVCSLFIS